MASFQDKVRGISVMLLSTKQKTSKSGLFSTIMLELMIDDCKILLISFARRVKTVE